MVTALQVMVTRQFNMFDPVVLTVGVLHAGTKRNVIPETARIEATIRTFSEESRRKMMEAVPRLLHGIAAAHGLEADVHYQEEYPLTINDENETTTAEKVIAGMFGESRHTRMATPPLSGSEDFSRVLAEVPPGTFVGLSAVAPPAPTTRRRRSTIRPTQCSTTVSSPTVPRCTPNSPCPVSPPSPATNSLPA